MQNHWNYTIYISHPIPRRYLELAKRDKFKPGSRRLEGRREGAVRVQPKQQEHSSGHQGTRGKSVGSQGRVGKGGSVASTRSGLMAAGFSLLTTNQTKAVGK